MNNPEHLTYSIDKNKLRIGAALGVIVITAGFALGSVIHTSSSSANEPAAPVTDDTAIGNESDQTTNNTSSVSNCTCGVGQNQRKKHQGKSSTS